jgi:endonuclease/exonuclease/phosphatase family metal-dependent hydrolase
MMAFPSTIRQWSAGVKQEAQQWVAEKSLLATSPAAHADVDCSVALSLRRSVSPSLPPPVSTLRHRRRVAIAVAVTLVGSFIYYSGDQRRPVSAAVGRSLEGTLHKTPRDGRTIRIATFNIHSGTGSDHRFDLGRTAEAVKGFDVVMLNEVQGPYFWQSEGQAEQLARLTDNRWLFAPTEERWWHHRFGNAALASANVDRWQTISLPSHSRGHRNMVLATIAHGGREIHVVGTHLDRNDPRDRAEQLEAAIGLFLSLAEPAVLLGDLNTTAEEPILKMLLDRSDVRDPLRDALGDDVPPHIDWIITRGLKTIKAGINDHGASDHPLVWAELE